MELRKSTICKQSKCHTCLEGRNNIDLKERFSSVNYDEECGCVTRICRSSVLGKAYFRCEDSR